MVEEAIGAFFNALTARFFGFIDWFTDPFWGWLWALFLLYVACFVLCYFFGAWWPRLRSIAGAMLIIGTFGLYAFAKGERAAREHDHGRRRDGN